MNNISEIGFYKELYFEELKRKDRIDTLISYPTTLLTIIIGGGLYFLQDENFKHMSGSETLIIRVLISVFFISIAIAIFFLMRMYLNNFKKYIYLPLSVDLSKREQELVSYFQSNLESQDENQVQKKAKEYFKNDLLQYYINFATKNQIINDERIKDFYTSRKILMLSLILLFLIGILTFIIK